MTKFQVKKREETLLKNSQELKYRTNSKKITKNGQFWTKNALKDPQWPKYEIFHYFSSPTYAHLSS